ncbi:MAG: ATP-binding protein [Candidatus Parabeggiatoa sp. nov. 2]|nr:MAG: ATP-binding protein [Gammaproteobacteria bacterium]
MPSLNLIKTRDAIQAFDFKSLFINELGWNNPHQIQSRSVSINETDYQIKPIATLGSVVVFEISGDIFPTAQIRADIRHKITALHHENLLIFVDKRPTPTKSIWYWLKPEPSKTPLPREHYYFQGQPGDLFISKLSALFVDMTELEDSGGDLSVVQVSQKLKDALDVETVTKKFYRDFQAQHLVFLELITGIDDERDRRWYASVLLNRLMFSWFLQKKGFLDQGNMNYLADKLAQSQQRGADRFYRHFLAKLFFDGFAKPKAQRSAKTNALLGNIRYLNGGLFLLHPLESRFSIQIPDQAFGNLFELFARYSWSLNDTPGGADNEINPDVLGYIFEKYINQKQFGAYYTRTEITEYLCEQTLHQLILQKINHPEIPGSLPARHFDTVPELLMSLDANLCHELLHKVLPKLSLLDPACGSGAFLIAMMKTLINIYWAIIGRIPFLPDRALKKWLTEQQREHANLSYFIKKQIITNNLFGVDIMAEATEIARLRLFLALVASAETVEELEPLPNIDFNILAGNSLLGLMQVEAQAFEKRQADLFRKSYQQISAEKNAMIRAYRDATSYADDLQQLREEIEAHKQQAKTVLDEILLDEFNHLKIKFEQATWDGKKNKPGKPIKRPLQLTDFADLHLFHWGYEFDEVLNKKGGFDAIMTNPPWEVFQTDEKEFFQQYIPEIQKKKLRIEDWKKQRATLMRDPELREAWLEYASRFSFVSKYLKNAPQYKNQISIVNGRNVGSKINLYSYFLEQCYNLLKNEGQCGIVIPSGIYTDLGATGLRHLLFNETQMTGLFCFENRKTIFEGVHRSFKFVVLSFEKGGKTTEFPAAFMRHEVNELARFPQSDALRVKTDLIYRLSPDSHSVMEFKNETDVSIAEKMLQFPLLGEKMDGAWNLALTTEFNMTTASHLFHTEPATGRLPLYEGKMIHQFEPQFAEARYWVDEKEGRKALLGKEEDKGQKLDYQRYRLGYRKISRNTDMRTMISTIFPKNNFASDSFIISSGNLLGYPDLLSFAGILNSLVLDYFLRQKVSANINMFYVYQLPIPRLTEKDSAFAPIVTRAAKLICTTPEFDELAKAVGLGSHKNGVTHPDKRAQLRAELDGMIAHLYGLTYDEFKPILSTFPIVKDEVKEAALVAYQQLENF